MDQPTLDAIMALQAQINLLLKQATAQPAQPAQPAPVAPMIGDHAVEMDSTIKPGEQTVTCQQTGHVLPLCQWDDRRGYGEGPGGYLLRAAKLLRPDLPGDQAEQTAVNLEAAFMQQGGSCPPNFYPNGDATPMAVKIPIQADWFLNQDAYRTQAQKAEIELEQQNVVNQLSTLQPGQIDIRGGITAAQFEANKRVGLAMGPQVVVNQIANWLGDQGSRPTVAVGNGWVGETGPKS